MKGGINMLKYKCDVLERLKAAGINTTRIRNEKLLPESTLTRLRAGAPIAWSGLETLCRLLHCQPADLIYFDFDED